MRQVSLPLPVSAVPADVGARALLLLRGGRLRAAEPELRDHQEAGVSEPTGTGAPHVPIRQGLWAWPSDAGQIREGGDSKRMQRE